MKKVLLAILALSLVSGALFASEDGKKKKRKKEKIECKKLSCPENKDCKNTTVCPPIPTNCL